MNIDGGISLGNDGTVSVGAFRWIIRVESKFGSTPAYVKAMRIIDGEEDVTGVISVNGEGLTVNGSEAWYDLGGRKLQGKPVKRGLYFNKGKKIVIN